MLPSRKRLSREEFGKFVLSKDIKTVFNELGTLKFTKSPENKVSVVISSKTEKRAVYRNKLKRRVYQLFSVYFKGVDTTNIYVLHVSKKAPHFTYLDLEKYLYDLLKKTTK